MTQTTIDRKLDVKKVWKAVLAEMEVQLSATSYKTWLSPTKAKELTDDEITIIFPNKHAVTNAEKLFGPLLKNSLKKITKRDYKLNFVIGNINKTKTMSPGPLFEQKTESKTTLDKLSKKSGLNVNYKLENYIIGSANQLAYAIASSIAREPGAKYNPFFLYSGVGLGKTHLIHAIGNKIIENSPDKKVLYVTGENFTNELIEAIRGGRNKGGVATDMFRKKYRKVDVLLIDDIQFIEGKESTQQEFFHTFNELYMSQKQIVITSDRPPEAFKNIEERITSRFKSGMMSDIQAPDYELRTAILRSKRDNNQENVPNEVIDFIAEHVATNIREVEGAYLQVLSYSQVNKEPLNVETAKKVLGNIVDEKHNKPPSLTSILKAVCKYYSITQADIKGKRRTKDIVLPRQVAMYLMYDLTQTPYMSIGEFLGGRDHTTVMHGFDKIKKEIETSLNLRKDLMNIKQGI